MRSWLISIALMLLAPNSTWASTITITYDALDQVTSITDPRGLTTRYTATTFEYAHNNSSTQPDRMTDESGETRFQFDVLNRLLRKTQTHNDGVTLSMANTLHPGGAVATLTYPSGQQVRYEQSYGQ